MFVDLPDGLRMHYEIVGEGEPLLLIAGTGCDDRYWKLQVELYAREFRCITITQRGAGKSTIFEDRAQYSTEQMADDAATLLKHLGCGPAHVTGHSLGSTVCQQLAIRHPGLVKSAQLHATWGRADTWLKRAWIGTTRYPLERGDKQAVFRTITAWMLSPDYLETWKPDYVADMLRYNLLENPNLEVGPGLLGHLHADELHNTLSLLPAIKCPVLVTAGEIDVLIPPRYGEEVAKRIPGARYHLFRGARSPHAYNWEMVDEFNAVTLGFLREVSG